MDDIKKLIADEKYDDALKKLLLIEGEYLLKIQCLYELQKYTELVTFFEQVVDKIENNYFEILGFYILSLIELEEFDRALMTLNEELSMPYIQDNYEEVLNNLYDDVLAKKQAFLVESGVYNIKLSDEEIIEVLLGDSEYEDKLNVVMQLEDYNIRAILSELETFLQSDNSPVLKTFILELMIKQQISDVILIYKNDLEFEYLPNANQLVFQDINYHATKDLLEDHLAKYPSYLNMCLDVLDMLVYIIYPQVIDYDETNYYAALIEYYVFSLNIDDLSDDFESYYTVDLKEIISNVDMLIALLESEEKYVKLI